MIKLRQKRLDELLKRAITEIIRFEVRDKRVTSTMITTERVKVSPDLHQANVYVSIMNPKNKKSMLIGLEHAKPFIKKRLAQKLNLRHTPEINFVYDTLEHNATEIESLIDEDKKERGY
ncbi:MAG: 30S ribosome-binding factor RbfA [Candidatus Cloacimonadia bacterium]